MVIFKIRHLVLLFMILAPYAMCQNEEPGTASGSKTLLGASIGINDFHQRDKYLSPYAFSGVNFASRLTFQVKSETDKHSIDGYFSVGSISADLQPRDVTQYVGGLSYSYVRLLSPWRVLGCPLQLSLGGGLSSYVMNTDFLTTDETGYTTYDQSWYWLHSVNAVISADYEIGEGRNFLLQCTIPVMGIVTRPENGHFMNQRDLDVAHDFLKAATGGKAEYIWNDFVLFAGIQYRQALSKHIGLLVDYRFGYVSSSKPAELLAMAAYMNSLSAGLVWDF